MPLSEHEERILAEIERQLAAEDPRFVARARRGRGWSTGTRRKLAVALAIAGVMSLMFLVVDIAFGAAGIALLFAAVLLGVTTVKDKPVQQRASAVPPEERG